MRIDSRLTPKLVAGEAGTSFESARQRGALQENYGNRHKSKAPQRSHPPGLAPFSRYYFRFKPHMDRSWRAGSVSWPKMFEATG